MWSFMEEENDNYWRLITKISSTFLPNFEYTNVEKEADTLVYIFEKCLGVEGSIFLLLSRSSDNESAM